MGQKNTNYDPLFLNGIQRSNISDVNKLDLNHNKQSHRASKVPNLPEIDLDFKKATIIDIAVLKHYRYWILPIKTLVAWIKDSGTFRHLTLADK